MNTTVYSCYFKIENTSFKQWINPDQGNERGKNKTNKQKQALEIGNQRDEEREEINTHYVKLNKAGFLEWLRN